MGRIYNLPTLEIICRGSDNIDISDASGQTGSVHHVEVKPKVQSESINVDLSGLTFESVAIKDGTDLGVHALQWVMTSMSNQTWSSVQNRTLTCDDSVKDTYMNGLKFLVSKGYNISGVTVSLSIGDVPEIMYDYTTKTLSATVDTGQSYDLSWSISVEQEAMYNPYNISISNIIEIVKTDDTHAELRFKNTDYFPWLFGIMTVTLTDSVSGISTEAEIECMVQWDVEISGPQTIDSSSNDFVYDILMRNLNTGAYAQLARKKTAMQWSIFDTATDPYLIGKATISNTSRRWGHLSMDWSNITADGEYQLSVRVKCPSQSSAYMFYPYWKDYATLVEVDTSPQASTVTYDLNDNWIVSTYTHPSDSTGMAMFQSESNHNVSGSTSTMYIRYSASNVPEDASVFICSNSEPGYDYTKIYALDSESTVAADTSNHQGTPSGLISTNYVRQNYTIPGDGQTHFIRIDYYKDSSGNQREDRGFVCVAPIDGQVINPYVPQVPISSVDISEIVYMGNGTYEFDVEISPASADPDDLQFDNWFSCTFTSASGDLGSTWTDTGFGTKKTKGSMFFNGLVSNSGQIGLVIKSYNDPAVFDEEIITVGEV